MSSIKVRKAGGREKFVAGVFLLAAVAIVARLFFLQIISYNKYASETANDSTRETAIKAARGLITDCNGIVLADNETVERVFISPADIKNEAERKLIATRLSEILGVDYNTVYTKACKTDRRDETIKKGATKEEADLVRRFIQEHELSSVHLVSSTERVYPYNNLLCHVLGFTGSDDQGLYGLEYQYDEYLTGVDGKIITAKNGLGQDMPYEYEEYIDAKDGYTLELTIDYNIQAILEKYLEECLEESEAANRVTAVIMDPDTGGVLAMATKPDFDCNDPYTLDYRSRALLDSLGLEKGSEEYLSKNTELLMQMWTNKAINDLYEPGSTFKPITCAMAIEEDLVTRETAFYCPGYRYIEGYGKVHCFRTWGHGPMTLETGLQKSCNPVLMDTAALLGTDSFYEYFKAFGYTSLTGIDLPGEASGIYHAENNFGNVSLAVYSFGQTFKTTAIQQITAISALANGGDLLTPHVVKRILDSDGNVVMDLEANVKRQVVSEDTAAEIVDILEKGVTNKVGAVNAGVSGFLIGAKTGTSEKRDKPDENGEFTLRIGSCISIAPADDPEVTMIVIVDEPTESKAEGSLIAAPYNSKIFAEVLPYLGVQPVYDEEDEEYRTVTLPTLTGKTVEDAKAALKKLGIECTVEGGGATVTGQMPKAGQSVTVKNGYVIIYTDNKTSTESVTVPDLIGKDVKACLEILKAKGLNPDFEGYVSSEGCYALAQYPEAGTKVPTGTAINVEFRYKDDTED